MTASTFGSFEQQPEGLIVELLVMRRRRVDVAARVADVGGGRQDAFQRRRVGGERRHLDAGERGNPVDAHRPGPPMWVSTATRPPAGTGSLENARTVS